MAVAHTFASYKARPQLQRTAARGARTSRPAVVHAQAMQATTTRQIRLPITPLTPENIKPFGQICSSTEDGKVFDHEDAQLVLDQGTPRFYIMRLPARGLRFHRITYHGKVTQCLGSLTPGADWYMALAAPSGSVANFPKPEDLRVFRIPYGSFLKLEVGTWHAGPLFTSPSHIDFFNLELKDTNVTDHNTHDYRKHDGTEFVLVLPDQEHEQPANAK